MTHTVIEIVFRAGQSFLGLDFATGQGYDSRHGPFIGPVTPTGPRKAFSRNGAAWLFSELG